jgi:hypothetical protein
MRTRFGGPGAANPATMRVQTQTRCLQRRSRARGRRVMKDVDQGWRYDSAFLGRAQMGRSVDACGCFDDGTPTGRLTRRRQVDATTALVPARRSSRVIVYRGPRCDPCRVR